MKQHWSRWLTKGRNKKYRYQNKSTKQNKLAVSKEQIEQNTFGFCISIEKQEKLSGLFHSVSVPIHSTEHPPNKNTTQNTSFYFAHVFRHLGPLCGNIFGDMSQELTIQKSSKAPIPTLSLSPAKTQFAIRRYQRTCAVDGWWEKVAHFLEPKLPVQLSEVWTNWNPKSFKQKADCIWYPKSL